MRTVLRRMLFLIFIVVIVVGSNPRGVDASSTLVVRDADNYTDVDFSGMSLADYCLFFVQDINLKYQTSKGCKGIARSSDILKYNSLQEICLNELEGGDNGLDCSALVYIIGKYFGSKCTATSTSTWCNMEVGVNIQEKIDIKDAGGFGGTIVPRAGDVIITFSGSQGHALMCIGDVNGEASMIHIGSSKLCGNCEEPGCMCCEIESGVGVHFCENCDPNVTSGSGQNKRFIRTASVNSYFSDSELAKLNSCVLYRPIYEDSRRQLVFDTGYTGTDYGSGLSEEVITEFIQKTGTLSEEAEIVGMPGVFEFDGESVVLVGRDGLGMSQRVALSSIGGSIGYGRLTISSIISIVTIAVGYLLWLYAFLILIGYVFDVSNNFIDFSVLSVLTLGRWQVVNEPDIKKTVKKNGKVFITKSGVIIRALVLGIVGTALISGWLLRLVSWVLDILYR